MPLSIKPAVKRSAQSRTNACHRSRSEGGCLWGTACQDTKTQCRAVPPPPPPARVKNPLWGVFQNALPSPPESAVAACNYFGNSHSTLLFVLIGGSRTGRSLWNAAVGSASQKLHLVKAHFCPANDMPLPDHIIPVDLLPGNCLWLRAKLRGNGCTVHARCTPFWIIAVVTPHTDPNKKSPKSRLCLAGWGGAAAAELVTPAHVAPHPNTH